LVGFQAFKIQSKIQSNFQSKNLFFSREKSIESYRPALEKNIEKSSCNRQLKIDKNQSFT